MKAFISLLVSTLCVWTIILFFTLYLPTTTGVHDPAARATHFLRWIPGIAIAFLAGATGAFFNGLLEIWKISTSSPANEATAPIPDNVQFIVRPLLGAFAGFILFLFFAVGGLSLTYERPDSVQSGASVGTLIYQLTPHSTSQLATTILLTFVGGYFFSIVPELLDAYRKRMFPKSNSKPRSKG